MDKWIGKVALITGANSGIGAGITRKLLDFGMIVIAVDKNTEYLENIKREYAKKLHPINVDLTHEHEVLAAFDWAERTLGGADVLVNCAGIGGHNSLLEGNSLEWRNILNINVVALSLCTREAVNSMRKRNVKEGHIIHISSNAAHMVPEYAPFHFYSATKHAVKALTEGLRQELQTLGSPIRVTSISPGIVKTPIVKNCLGDEIDKIVYEKNPYLDVDDIAAAVQYILTTPSRVQIQDIVIKPTGSRT